MKTLLLAWRRYWFSASPSINLAVTRVVVAGYQLWAITRPGYRSQLMGRTALPDALYDPLPVLHMLVWPLGWNYRPDAGVLDAVLIVTIAAGVLAVVGFRTNFGLVVFTLGCVFLQSFLWSFGDFHHPETIPIIALGLLALSPAGGVLSLDDLGKRLRAASIRGAPPDFDLKKEESRYAGWPLKLIGWVLVLAYASAALSKLTASGIGWADGYTLSWYLARDGLRWDVPAAVWLSQQHSAVVLLSWMTLLIEGGFVLVMLFPVTRWIFLPMGAGMHLGIYLLIRARFFGWIAAYSALVPWRALLERSAQWLGRPAAPVKVLYDGTCPLCLRTMAFFRYWDWLERLEMRTLQDQGSEKSYDSGTSDSWKSMWVRDAEDQDYEGFFALRRLIRELPPLWPMLPVLYFPGAARVGPAVYRWIAAHRSRRQGGNGCCRLHQSE